MEPVTQVERTFVWTLVTEVTAVCGGGASADFMLAAWGAASGRVHAALAAGTLASEAGMQEEAAAILRAVAASVDLFDDATVRLRICAAQ